MNKTVQLLIKILVIIGFLGVLLSVAFDWGGRFEIVCCTVAAVGSFILFKQKKMRE